MSSSTAEQPVSTLTFEPLTATRWNDFVSLFGERGACGGCWCMLWRARRKQFEQQKGAANKKAMKSLVDAGEVPGLLAYSQGCAVGWCSIGPRETFGTLSRSRILKPVDDRAVWSVSCLFINKNFRKRGVSVALLDAAANYARSQGGKLIEGYPVEPKAGKPIPAAFAWTGIPAAFIAAGFKEVARRSPTRPIMRRKLT